MPAFLALIPVKDWVYLGLIIALLSSFGAYTIHERHVGAAREVAALERSSQKLQADADAKVAKLTADHVTQIAKIVGVLDAQHQIDSTQHDNDAQRLREYDTYRRRNPPLGSPTSGPGTAVQGSGGDSGSDDRFSSLEQVALRLAAAGRNAKSALTACMDDRDSLTGK